MSALVLLALLAVPAPVDLTVRDAARSRDVPVRVYLPEGTAPAAVILFSHGLGGSREANAFLGQHWAANGFVAVFLQHPGSDTSTWKGVEPAGRLAALKDAANVENFLLRAGDVTATLDALSVWNKQPAHALAGRLDLAHVGMSGHSFGAVTTQAVSGQVLPYGKSLTDARIKAAMALSPSVPRRGDAKTAFASVKVPWLLITGTHDEAPIGGATAASRLGVFPALPAGQKYQLVLDGAEHSAFTDRALPGDSRPRNPNHHRLLLAVSTAFFKATLRGDADASAWLAGPDLRSQLAAGDQWSSK